MKQSLTLSYGEIRAARAHLDDPDVLERAKTSPALQSALEHWRPRNWWGVPVAPETLMAIAETDGIPLAWVPRRELVAQLGAADGRDERLVLLVEHAGEVLEDCRDAIAECNDPELADLVSLADAAVACFDPHHQAAMALAVSVSERPALWASSPRVHAFDSPQERLAWTAKLPRSGYQRAKAELDSSTNNAASDLMWRVLAAPIPHFFTPWHPGSGEPVPTALSRHVVAHQAGAAHFSRGNALIAVMLMASLLRAQQAWAEEIGPPDEQR